MQSTTGLLKSRLCAAALLSLALSVALSSCKKGDGSDDDPQDPDKINYSGTFVKSVSDVVTSATGTVTGSFNPTTRELTYSVNWNGLTSKVVDMHFHDEGPVIIHIEGFAETTTGSMTMKKAIFTQDQATDLAAGKVYIQIHTENYPGGEIIATLSKGSGSTPDPDPDPDPDPYVPPY